MSLVREILLTYRAPRLALRRQLAGGQREDRALIYLYLGCVLVFVSSLPRHSRDAFLNPEIPLEARIGGALLAWLIIMPLVLYGLAALSHLVARQFGGQGTWFGARLALFWAVLSAAPLWLLFGMVAGFNGPGPGLGFVGALGFAAFVIFWILGLIEAEGQTEPRVTA